MGSMKPSSSDSPSTPSEGSGDKSGKEACRLSASTRAPRGLILRRKRECHHIHPRASQKLLLHHLRLLHPPGPVPRSIAPTPPCSKLIPSVLLSCNTQCGRSSTTNMLPSASHSGSVRNEQTVVDSSTCVPSSGLPPKRLARIMGMTALGMAL